MRCILWKGPYLACPRPETSFLGNSVQNSTDLQNIPSQFHKFIFQANAQRISPSSCFYGGKKQITSWRVYKKVGCQRHKASSYCPGKNCPRLGFGAESPFYLFIILRTLDNNQGDRGRRRLNFAYFAFPGKYFFRATTIVYSL